MKQEIIEILLFSGELPETRMFRLSLNLRYIISESRVESTDKSKVNKFTQNLE